MLGRQRLLWLLAQGRLVCDLDFRLCSKKHEALMSDPQRHGSSIQALRRAGPVGRVSEAFHVSSCKIPGWVGVREQGRPKDPDADSRWHDLG